MESRDPKMNEADGVAVRIANLSPAKLAVLARQLKERNANVERRPSITRRSESETVIPVLASQYDMWVMEQLHPDRALYIMPGSWPLKGRVNFNALEQSLSEIVRRKEVLRTTFPAIDGEPVQAVALASPRSLPVVDLRALPERQRWSQAGTLGLEDNTRKFDLSEESPLRLAFLMLSDNETVLLHSMHHIAVDGWSSYLFINERERLYNAFSNGTPSPLDELPIQCGDFALWQRRWLEGEEAEAQLSYWKRQLNGSSPQLELPRDRPRARKQFSGAWQRTQLSPARCEALRQLTREEGATLFMTFLAVLDGVLYRYTGQEDLNVGTLFPTRNRPETRELIGPFFNTLVLRTELSGRLTFRELLRRARRTTLEAHSNSDFPFAELEGVLRSDNDFGVGPLFRVRLGMATPQSFPSPGELPAEEVDDLMGMATQGFSHLAAMDFDVEETLNGNRPRKATVQGALEHAVGVNLDFDLALYVHEAGEQLELRMWYNTNLYDSTTAGRMLRDLRRFVEEVSRGPNQEIGSVDLLTEPSRHQLLEEWNDTHLDYESERTFWELFEARAALTPDAVAIGFEDEHVSYQTLSERAARLAGSLRALGVGCEGLVAVAAGRGISFLTVMLASFKLGAAYLPLDPSDPSRRLHQIISQSKAEVVLTTNEMMADVLKAIEGMPPQQRPAVAAVETLIEREPPAVRPAAIGVPRNKAYVMYTSGSTGAPKGVMVEQAGMVNHIFSKITDLRLTEADVVVQNASERFDISVWQFLAALVVGARVQVVGDEIAQDPIRLFEAVAREGVTILEVEPSLLVSALEEMTAEAAARPGWLR